MHTEGVPSAKFLPKPGPGFPLSPGTALKQVRVLYKRGSKLVIGMPMSGPRPKDFYFEFESGKSALEVCREYLDLIKKLTEDAKGQIA